MQRVVGGVDHVGRDPDRRPAPAAIVGALDDHPGDRRGAGLGRQDAHLVVGKVHVLERRVGRGQRLTECCVEGVHRAVALGDDHPRRAADLDLDRRLGQRDQLVPGVEPALVDDPEADQAEVVRHLAERAPRQELEARVGALVGVAARLALLDRPRAAPGSGPRPPRPRGRSRRAASSGSRGRPGRRPRCGADCRPPRARCARSCSGP